MQEEFRLPRLAAVYDVLDDDRSDLDPYVAVLDELGVRRVVDVGCGTGVLALRLAGSGCDVVGVDPATASLDVARAKPGAGLVRWLDGGAEVLDGAGVTGLDAAVLTANVVMCLDERQWPATLGALHGALRPGGHLVFETRRPDARAWEHWDRAQTHRVTALPTGGTVESWVEVTQLRWPDVGVRWTFVFSTDGATVPSEMVLRYRGADELRADLAGHGFEVVDVRDAPDRPGREFVVLARRSTDARDTVVTGVLSPGMQALRAGRLATCHGPTVSPTSASVTTC